MQKIILILCLLLSPALAWATEAWRLSGLEINALNRPQSAFCYEDALFTSNSGSDTTKSDGFILRYNLADSTETKFLQNQLYNPKGFVIARNYLLLIDQNMDGQGPGLLLADLRRDTVISKLALANAAELHGITALNSSNFVVSDRGHNLLLTVSIDMDNQILATPWVMDIFEAGGVSLHNSFIYAAGSALDEKTQQNKAASIYQIDPLTTVTQRFVTLTQTNTDCLSPLAGHRGYLFVGDGATPTQEAASIYVISISAKRRVAKIEVPLGVTDIAVRDNALYLTIPSQNKVVCLELDFDALGR